MKTKLSILAALALSASACHAPEPEDAPKGKTTPIYNETTGKLQEITSDRNGDGKIDARAHMDGVHFKSIDIDRNHDGKPDRWEYYDSPAAASDAGASGSAVGAGASGSAVGAGASGSAVGAGASGSAVGAGFSRPRQNMLVRAEEANGTDPKKITRKEFYDKGRISRVEEDADADGRLDKWEWYENGGLVRSELDLQGKGFPDRRMIYGRNGQIERVEADPDGDGKFVLWKSGGNQP